MIVDSDAEVHLGDPAHKHLWTNVTKLNVPLQLETVGDVLTLDVIGDLLCDDIKCHGCVFNSLLSVSLFSAIRSEKDDFSNERCPEDYEVLRGPRGNVKFERSDDLNHLVNNDKECVFFSRFAHI